ncbi:membrane protein FxsA [Bacillus sp. HMF5848]|uniref:FxsA family protein n=1 Tax=Bacillus sp. HMF5848 TaxID=2495421 RepID=UPI000F7B6E54|nr:FxsA family protein [Bacillus sp. HMF5848]RSK28134.1 membrane protein FxsA [Bacillus sp. HMF5848]
MLRILLALIIIVPALEIGLLVLAGNIIGPWPTVLLIILTGVLGAFLAKQQGLRTLQNAQMQVNQGHIPGESVIDGLCILVGGVVLLTPGFITDAIGFFLLFPATRAIIKPFLVKVIRRMMDRGQFTIIR